MKNALFKFATDLVTGGVSAASAAVLLLNLDVTNWKVVAVLAAIGFTNGVINAARRALPSS